MSARELAEREALDGIEPMGQRRRDYQTAVLCWQLALCNWSGQGRQPELNDYLQWFEFGDRTTDATDDEALLSALERAAQ